MIKYFYPVKIFFFSAWTKKQMWVTRLTQFAGEWYFFNLHLRWTKCSVYLINLFFLLTRTGSRTIARRIITPRAIAPDNYPPDKCPWTIASRKIASRTIVLQGNCLRIVAPKTIASSKITAREIGAWIIVLWIITPG